MPQSSPIRLTYAEGFRCIGPACEDTCCQGWTVPVDEATYERYRNLPASPLRDLINSNVLVNIEPAEKAWPASFAKIQMDAAHQCPMLGADRLCRIHAELGEEFLSHVCARYPRVAQTIAGVEEMGLALSCPEAARLVLLDPNLLAPTLLDPELLRTALVTPGSLDAEPQQQAAPLLGWFWPIRAAVLALLRNRAYPLWQRLFLLSVFCRRLDGIANGELKRGVPEFLNDFAASVASGALRPAMESLPLDRAAQLDVVLRLAGLMLHRSNVRPRFVECVQAFSAGLGSGPGATLESLTAQCARAHDRYYAPFFDRHPHILENYLANAMVRSRFPFGREGAPAQGPLSMSRECASLMAQFALTKGFLIGVAGFYREAFSAEHVVHTVQATSKHFEHHPEFLKLAYELLVESRMDGARGLAILLRNAEPNPFRPVVPERPAPSVQVGVRAVP